MEGQHNTHYIENWACRRSRIGVDVVHVVGTTYMIVAKKRGEMEQDSGGEQRGDVGENCRGKERDEDASN